MSRQQPSRVWRQLLLQMCEKQVIVCRVLYYALNHACRTCISLSLVVHQGVMQGVINVITYSTTSHTDRLYRSTPSLYRPAFHKTEIKVSYTKILINEVISIQHLV